MLIYLLFAYAILYTNNNKRCKWRWGAKSVFSPIATWKNGKLPGTSLIYKVNENPIDFIQRGSNYRFTFPWNTIRGRQIIRIRRDAIDSFTYCSNVCPSALNICLGHRFFYSIRIDWETDANKWTDFTTIRMRQTMGGGKNLHRIYATRFNSSLFHFILCARRYESFVILNRRQTVYSSLSNIHIWANGFVQLTHHSSFKSRSMYDYRFLYVWINLLLTAIEIASNISSGKFYCHSQLIGKLKRPRNNGKNENMENMKIST